MDAAVFVPGVSCSTRSNVTPGIQEVSKANRTQVKVEPVCQGVKGEMDSRGGPVFLSTSGPVVNWCANGPASSQCKSQSQLKGAQEKHGCGASASVVKQIRVDL